MIVSRSPVTPVGPALVFTAPIDITDALITSRGSAVFDGLVIENTSYSANNGAAIYVTTTQPVTIQNCTLKAQKNCIGSVNSGTNVTVLNCLGVARNTTQAGQTAGRFVSLYQPASLIVENNTMIGGGIYSDGSPAVGGATIYRVRYNRALNVDGRLSDGAGGYVFERANTAGTYFQTRQMVQINNGDFPAGGEIAWNECVNDPFISRPEDSINIYGARGTEALPVRIHDNYIQGGSPTRPYDVGFSGTGIVCEHDSRYVLIEDNQIVSYGNAAITLVNSDHCRALRNRAVGDGKIAGQVSFSRREAFLLYNAESVPPGAQTTTCSFEDNLHAWSGPGGSLTAAYAPEAGSNGNFLSGMTSLGTPDEAMELAEWALWRAKVAAAGVRLGSTLAV